MSELFVTSLAAAQANVLAGAQRRVDDLNAAITADYQTTWADFVDRVTGGHEDNTNPPQPPKAYVVGYVTDSTGDPGPILWAYPMRGTDPVCAMPAVPGVVQHATGTMLIGTSNPSAPQWFNAKTGDTTPVGTVAPGTSQDGISGLFQKVGAPVGFGYFLKIG